MRFTALFLLAIVAALAVAGCTSQPNSPSDGTIKLTADEFGVYSPKEIRVKLGSTVRIEGDPETLAGPMDTIVVDGYDVQKLVAPGDNVLEFVADRPGEFKVRCANGMGDGKLIVEA